MIKNKKNHLFLAYWLTYAFTASAEIRPFLDINTGVQLDQTAETLSIGGGLQLSPSLSLDINYQSMGDAKGGDSDAISASTSFLNAGIRYDREFVPDVSIYSRMGMAYFDVEKKTNDAEIINTSGLAPIGSVGLAYQINNHLSMNAAYQLILGVGDNHTRTYDSNAIMIGLRYHFNPITIEKSDSGISPKPATSDILTYNAATQLANANIATESLNLSNVVLFPIDSSVQKNNIAVDKYLIQLKENPLSRALIKGYTDNTGNLQYNQKLSERRAHSIASFFSQNGISRDRLDIIGYGSKHPIASNLTDTGRSKNRRVEIEILTKNPH